MLHQPGIEPGAPRWQREILPLNHWCRSNCDHIYWARRLIKNQPSDRNSFGVSCMGEAKTKNVCQLLHVGSNHGPYG
jgi:hypothetical protein